MGDGRLGWKGGSGGGGVTSSPYVGPQLVITGPMDLAILTHFDNVLFEPHPCLF